MTGDSDKIQFFDIKTRKSENKISGINLYPGLSNNMININEKLLAVGGTDNIFIIDVINQKKINEIKMPGSNYITCFCKLNDNCLITGDCSCSIRQLKISEDNLIQEKSKEKAHECQIRMIEKFDKLFLSYFPSLTNEICKESDIITNPIQRKCFANIFNVFDCPMIVALDDLNNIEDIDNYCNKIDENLYYINEIGEERKSIEELLTKGNYTFGMPEMKDFLKEYNNNLKKFKTNKTLSYSDFETEEEFRKENLLQIQHFKNTSLIQDLPIPQVDTDIIYTSSINNYRRIFKKR